MYSPAIISTEQTVHPLPSRSDRFNLVLTLNSFSEGAPFLVEIPPYSGLGPIDLIPSVQDSSLILGSNISAQTSPSPAAFWSRPNSLERSGRWI